LPQLRPPVVVWLAEGGRYDRTIARLASRSV
jgi:hypothetical protein